MLVTCSSAGAELLQLPHNYSDEQIKQICFSHSIEHSSVSIITEHESKSSLIPLILTEPFLQSHM
jgi:hypothetical protein